MDNRCVAYHYCKSLTLYEKQVHSNLVFLHNIQAMANTATRIHCPTALPLTTEVSSCIGELPNCGSSKEDGSGVNVSGLRVGGGHLVGAGDSGNVCCTTPVGGIDGGSVVCTVGNVGESVKLPCCIEEVSTGNVVPCVVFVVDDGGAVVPGLGAGTSRGGGPMRGVGCGGRVGNGVMGATVGGGITATVGKGVGANVTSAVGDAVGGAVARLNRWQGSGRYRW